MARFLANAGCFGLAAKPERKIKNTLKMDTAYNTSSNLFQFEGKLTRSADFERHSG